MASFDIVCEIDTQEVSNAVDQARREIKNRYDTVIFCFHAEQCFTIFQNSQLFVKWKVCLEMTDPGKLCFQTKNIFKIPK